MVDTNDDIHIDTHEVDGNKILAEETWFFREDWGLAGSIQGIIRNDLQSRTRMLAFSAP